MPYSHWSRRFHRDTILHPQLQIVFVPSPFTPLISRNISSFHFLRFWLLVPQRSTELFLSFMVELHMCSVPLILGSFRAIQSQHRFQACQSAHKADFQMEWSTCLAAVVLTKVFHQPPNYFLPYYEVCPHILTSCSLCLCLDLSSLAILCVVFFEITNPMGFE